MKLEINNVPYLIIGILLVLIFFNTCGGRKGDSDKDNNKVDTLYIDRIIEGEKVTIVDTQFVPKLVYRTDPKYLDSIRKLKSHNEQLEYLLSQLSTRVYDTTYTFQRGRLTIRDSVQGYLEGRSLIWDLDDIEYKEKVITITKEKYPKFALSAGPSVQMTTDFSTFIERPTLGGEIGLRNKRGYNLDFGINLKKDVNVSLKKDIFVLY